jgi:PAS domain S-box-containing protein
MSQILESLPFPAVQYSQKAELGGEGSHFYINQANARWQELFVANLSFDVTSVDEFLQGVLERCVGLGEDSFQIKSDDFVPVLFFWGRKLNSEKGVEEWLIMALDSANQGMTESHNLLHRIEELNITHEQDELALRISLRHLKAFFDESTGGKALVGLDGELISTNRSLNHILNWPDAPTPNIHEDRSIPWTKKARAVLQEHFNRLITGGEPIHNLELEVDAADGQQIILWVSLSPVYDSLGHLLYVAAEFTDVTQQVQDKRQLKVQAQALEVSNRELARSNAELERFAFVASHDLQEPLRKICVFGERLENELKKSNTSGQSAVYLNRILASTQRMTMLIHDVLDYSRLSQKSIALDAVDLNNLLHEMTQDFDFKGATLYLNPLPIVLGNRARLSRLFANLISNASKFRGTGHSEIHIEQRFDLATPEFCVIAVRDNGIGFDMENADKIFDVFARLHARDLYEGTGIGLAICRRIARENGGDVWAESSLNQGSTFYVRLSMPTQVNNEIINDRN